MAATAQAATRQQLDELDALLEKMLTRPAGPSDPSAASTHVPPSAASPLAQKLAGMMAGPPTPPQFPTPEVAYGLPPAAAFAASSATMASAAPPAAPAAKPRWAIELNPREGSSVIANRTAPPQAVAPPSPAVPLAVRPIAPPQNSLPSHGFVGEGPGVRVIPLTLRPLQWLNAGYDGFMTSVIPLGWLFTGQAARVLMGYAGAAMLAASVIWAVMLWAGWTW